MRQLLGEFWTSTRTWVSLACWGLIIVGLVMLAMAYQRRDFRRATDEATKQTIEALRAEVQVLKLQNAASIDDRQRIKAKLGAMERAVDAVEKEQSQP